MEALRNNKVIKWTSRAQTCTSPANSEAPAAQSVRDHGQRHPWRTQSMWEAVPQRFSAARTPLAAGHLEDAHAGVLGSNGAKWIKELFSPTSRQKAPNSTSVCANIVTSVYQK